MTYLKQFSFYILIYSFCFLYSCDNEQEDKGNSTSEAVIEDEETRDNKEDFLSELSSIFLDSLISDLETDDSIFSLRLIQEKTKKWQSAWSKILKEKIKACLIDNELKQEEVITELAAGFAKCTFKSLAQMKEELKQEDVENLLPSINASFLKTTLSKLPETISSAKSESTQQEASEIFIKASAEAYQEIGLNEKRFAELIGRSVKKCITKWRKHSAQSLADGVEKIITSSLNSAGDLSKSDNDFEKAVDTVTENAVLALSEENTKNKVKPETRKESLSRISSAAVKGLFKVKRQINTDSKVKIMQNINDKTNSKLLKSKYGQDAIAQSVDSFNKASRLQESKLTLEKIQSLEKESLEKTTKLLMQAEELAEKANEILRELIKLRSKSYQQRADLKKEQKKILSKSFIRPRCKVL